MNQIDVLTVNTIRVLAADIVQKAKSGHPGLPIGSAPMAYTLFAKELKFNPKNPKWRNRDRFILSAGHGSALQYALLHLFGYDMTIDDLKSFRQWGAKTPGHPEFGHTPGVEITTGPLGQGIANAVGMAMAEAHMAAKFNKDGFPVFDHYTYALVGDGCLMEGIASEAASLAGHLKLGKLIVMYDKNDITIEGNINVAFTEDVGKRFEAYGWQVLTVENGNADIDAIQEALEKAKDEKEKPSLVIVKTTIGYNSPLAGTSACHGSPLGQENIDILKANLGFDYKEPFTVPDEVYEHTNRIAETGVARENVYNKMMAGYEKQYPELAKQLEKYYGPMCPHIFDDYFYEFDKALSTRKASNAVLNRLASKLPNLIGGSADLAGSNLTIMNDREWFSAENYAGSNIHFGVREFAMAAIANGMAAYGGLKPYVATFFVFSDYLKHSIRLSALMNLPVIYVMTHDSIGVGEDGPTHEPIEQLATMRAMPNTYMWRPADAKETAAAYEFALKANAPSVLALTRQDVPLYEGTGKAALKGAYVLKDSENPQVILIGTGSEVELCMNAYDQLKAEGIEARVVSMPCMEAFEEQSEEYKESVLPKNITARVAVEAGASYGWHKYVGIDGKTVCIDRFGASAPAKVLFKEFGFTTENVVEAAKRVLGK